MAKSDKKSKKRPPSSGEYVAAAEEAGVRDDRVSHYLKEMRAKDEARAILNAERAASLYMQPPPMEELSLMISRERKPLHYTIEGLHPAGSNTLIAAQFKVGKTMLMANLAKAYADGDRFLGYFDMNPGAGRLAYFNYELNEDMLVDQYFKPLGITNLDRIVVWNLRGRNFDLRSKEAFDDAVRWLKKMGCDAAIMDPFGAAARLLVCRTRTTTVRPVTGCSDALTH